MEPILEVRGLGKSYPGFELRDIQLELPRGHILGLVGPNGAGKTTTIKAIMGLVRPNRGEIRVFGLDIARKPREVKRRIGYIGENQNFYDELTVEWTASFVGQYYPTWDQEHFLSLAKRYGVDVRKRVGALSKGTKVKLALALALAHMPELLILDEPTSGLDPIIRREVLSELMEFVQDDIRSVLFSSHITQDVERISDYVALIAGGRLVEFGEKDEVLSGGAGSIEDIMMNLRKDGIRHA